LHSKEGAKLQAASNKRQAGKKDLTNAIG